MDDEVFIFPASFAQQRFWMLEQLEPGSAAYTIPVALRIDGAFDAPAFCRALNEVISRHEALRTVFEVHEGEPVQVVLPRLVVAVPVTNLGETPSDERDALVCAAAAQEANTPFDLARGPLLRARILRLAPTAHVLLLTLHHIVADGWSIGVLFTELGRLYGEHTGGAAANLAPLPLQYADYTLWQRRTLDGAALERHLAHWRTVLGGRLAPLDLPTDRPRPPVQTHAGGRVAAVIPAATVGAIRDLAIRAGATPFMAFLAAYQLLLHRHSAQDDIIVGSPVAGRGRSELEPLIGLFINTLVYRTDFSDDPSFGVLLGRVRDAATAAYAHQDLPFERLVEALQPARDRSRSPIFQAAFLMGAVGSSDLTVGSLRASAVDAAKLAAKFDVTLSLTERDGALRASLEFNSDLFDAGTAERMLAHYLTLLASAARMPDAPASALPMLGTAERRAVTEAWNRTDRDLPDPPTIAAMFERQVTARPDATAVVADDATLTYRELDARAGRIARRLADTGVAPGSLVGVCTERSAAMVAALLGVLKAGAAYVPLDPDFPAQRLAHMASDAALSVALVDGTGARMLTGLVPMLLAVADAGSEGAGLPPGAAVAPDDLAYVIYTSGSTGQPKGVEIPQRAIANLLAAMHASPGLAAADRLLAVTTLSFDIAALELFGPLTAGASVVVASRDAARNPSALSELIGRSGATVMQATPATWRMLIAHGWPGHGAMRIWCGGEALSPQLAADLLPRCAELWNMYGPTETTVWSTVNRITRPEDAASIGGPIANTRLYVVDRRGEPVPVGVPGELCIGGHGIARGYRGRPDLTAERFVPDRFSSQEARLYRTGDLVSWTPGGTLRFLGRIDHQVKVRGFRIELGEIEVALARQPGVAAAVVVASPAPDGEQRLVAYIVASPAGAPAPAELTAGLRASLPQYMLPSAYMMLETLPLTPNGKVDRRALPEPTAEAARSTAFVPPRTAVEEMVAAIWAEVLRRGPIGVHDDFFELGGHSLLATRLMARLQAAFAVSVPWRTLFDTPTVAALALAVEDALGAAGGESDVADLLASLEAMSDEEAARMLAADQAGGAA